MRLKFVRRSTCDVACFLNKFFSFEHSRLKQRSVSRTVTENNFFTESKTNIFAVLIVNANFVFTTIVLLDQRRWRKKIAIPERRAARWTYGSKKNGMARQYEKMSNMDWRQSYKVSRSMGTAAALQESCADRSSAHVAVLRRKPDGKDHCPKRSRMDKIEKNVMDIGVRDGETVAPNRNRWYARRQWASTAFEKPKKDFYSKTKWCFIFYFFHDVLFTLFLSVSFRRSNSTLKIRFSSNSTIALQQ